MYISSIAQFALLAVSVAIIFTFIEPMFGEIKSVQDETATYEDALAKAAEFNAQLQSLSAQLASFRQVDLARLDTYLPTEIDTLTVMADIEAIARRNSLIVNELKALDVVNPNTDVSFDQAAMTDLDGDGLPDPGTEAAELPPAVSYQDFQLLATGQYENLKAMLRDFEQNKYLLEVASLRFGVVSADVGSEVRDTGVPEGTYAVTLRAFAYDYAPTQQNEPLPIAP